MSVPSAAFTSSCVSITSAVGRSAGKVAGVGVAAVVETGMPAAFQALKPPLSTLILG
ncbi:hypothetical protein D9M69_678950 [compost metagenome]